MQQWIRNREIRGLVTFSIDDVRRAFPGVSGTTIATSIQRAIKSCRIQNVHNGFYVIVPPQYALNGDLPPSYYIDELMKWLGKPYYLCLLSASAMYGAAHQRAMVEQVMTVSPRSKVSGRNALLQWNYRQDIPQNLLLETNTEMGVMKYSNAELTAVDLVQFASHIGGFQRAATVLSELIESVEMDKMHEVFPYTTAATIQRLGYLMEFVLMEYEKADALFGKMKEHFRTLKLVRMRNDIEKNVECHPNRWHVNMNIEIELDEL